MKFPSIRCLSVVVLLFSTLACFQLANSQNMPSGPNLGGMTGKASSSYVISPLDYLRVTLFVADEMQFTSDLRVSQSGTISVPHLGTLGVAGLSIDEMRELLYEPYNRDYYVNPHLDITVLAYSERSVTVIGKVNRQGLIPFPSEKELTLLEAIAAAGGWSNDRLSDKRNVTITRSNADGEKYVIEVDARNLTTRDHPLQEGDLINVPERMW